MHIEQAKALMASTHISAINRGERANAYMLESPPGLGKSDGVFQTAEIVCLEIKQPVGVIVSMLASITSPDVRGFMIPVRVEGMTVPKTVFTVPPWYPTQDAIYVVEPNKDGVTATWHQPGEWQGPLPVVGFVFLDEWGQAEEDVRKPAAELLLHGEVGQHRLPMHWRVVGAQNRVSDRSGVMRELMHIINRRCLLRIEPHLPSWRRWADNQPAEKQPHFLTIAFAQNQPDIVFSRTMPDSPDPFCTPRSLCMMDRDIRVLQTQEDLDHDRLPMTALARELCGGFIGDRPADQFFVHLRFATELPDIEDILERPMQAKVPAGKDAQMVVAFKIVPFVEEDTARNIMRYITRLGQEMQRLAMSTFVGDGKIVVETTVDKQASLAQVRRLKALSVTPEYTKWIMENKDVLVAAYS